MIFDIGIALILALWVFGIVVLLKGALLILNLLFKPKPKKKGGVIVTFPDDFNPPTKGRL